jgi:predicted P-loop ATPase
MTKKLSKGDVGNLIQLHDRNQRPQVPADAVPAMVKKAQKYMNAMAQGFTDLTNTGDIKPTCANTRHAIMTLGIQCRYDRFRDRMEVGGHPISAFAGELSDNACLWLRKLIEEEFSFDPGREKALDTAVQLCLENQFDPVLSYLNELKWDGKLRLGRWLIDYAGAEDTPFNRAVSRISLVAMVRRARQPGCKFDQIIVLEGKEGTQKSSLLERLAGAGFFSDQTILGLADRDQQERLRGVWVYEIADLTNVTRAEVEHVKAFASRTHDRARPAYGRVLLSLPRRSVIWATTNSSQYLRSHTGNRRFWPVETGIIKLADFERDRDQLFAEAAVMEAEGASIVLPEELWQEATEQQEQRREFDPWEDALTDVKGVIVVNEKTGQHEERVLSSDILWLTLGITKDRQTDHQAKRVASAMRLNGWAGPTVMRVNGMRGRGFARPAKKAAEGA